MANKTLRILIADSRHSQTLLMERMLNRLGYFRIATASTLAEARLLGRFRECPFDVMIANARLLTSEQLDCTSLAEVCLSALIYQSQYLPMVHTLLIAEGSLVRLQGALDVSSLDRFMALVDPSAMHRREQNLAVHA